MELDLDACRNCGAETELRKAGIPYYLDCVDEAQDGDLPFSTPNAGQRQARREMIKSLRPISTVPSYY